MNANTTADAARDYRSLRESHGAVDLASWGVIRLAGPDARSFLQGLATQDFEAPPVAQGAPGPDVAPASTTLFLSEKGRPIALAWVSVAGSSAIVIADGGARSALAPHFERFRVMEEVEFEGPEGMPRLAGLVGPGRADALRSLAAATGSQAIEAEPLSFLLLPASAGSPAPRGLVFADPDAFEAWRIAAGLPRTGIDFDLDRIATELSLSDAISPSKGCYVGQEVVARTSNRGQVRRQRVGFRFGGSGDPLPHRAEILASGAPAGYVTSAAREPGTGEGLGMGFLSTDAIAAAAPIHAVVGGREVPLRLGAWPL